MPVELSDSVRENGRDANRKDAVVDGASGRGSTVAAAPDSEALCVEQFGTDGVRMIGSAGAQVGTDGLGRFRPSASLTSPGVVVSEERSEDPIPLFRFFVSLLAGRP